MVDLEELRDQLVARYEAGESMRALERSLGLPRDHLKRQFVAWGVPIRGVAEAQRLRPGWKTPLDGLAR